MLIVLAFLLLIDMAPILVLGGIAAGAIGRATSLNSGNLLLPLSLLLATIACMAYAILTARRGRFGPAIGVAAIPAVLSVLAVAVLYYALSHMGAHH